LEINFQPWSALSQGDTVVVKIPSIKVEEPDVTSAWEIPDTYTPLNALSTEYYSSSATSTLKCIFSDGTYHTPSEGGCVESAGYITATVPD